MDRLFHLGTTDSPLFSCLDVKDLIQLAKVNRRTRGCVAGYKRAAHSIVKTLSPYFTDEEIEQFRVLQSYTGTLISGSTALSFFNRTVYPGSDLDIYVEHRYSAEIALFLKTLGYAFAPRAKQAKDLLVAIHSISERFIRPDEDIYLGQGIADVYDFTRGGAKIQLITSISCPLDIILRFHSTVVMNIITSQYAISFYPFATFVWRNALVLRRQAAGIEKYEQRGWSMIDKPRTYEMTTPGHDFHSRSRFVGDSRCWVMELPKTKEDLAPETIFINSWRLSYTSAFMDNVALMTFDVPLPHSSLKYRYTLAPRIDFSDLEKRWAYRIKNHRSNRYDAELSEMLRRNDRVGDPLRCRDTGPRRDSGYPILDLLPPRPHLAMKKLLEI
ncbi:hypothetical protein C8J56DRAFT_1032351 [Mycena floridula]|nr:hypothetical protein C8J56DRAFT_1032351 [Mycena floridula]